MVPACKEAIEKARADNWDTLVNLPPGVKYKGHLSAPVSEIISQHHLEPFLEMGE